MNNETITQSHPIPAGTEVIFGRLTAPHQFTQITVNAAGSALANGTRWRLYSITAAGAALIQECELQKATLSSKRLLHNVEDGALVELRGFNPNNADTIAITTSLVGSDPGCCTEGTGGGDAFFVWGRHAESPTGTIFLTQGFDAQSDPDAVALIADAPVPVPRDGILSQFRVHQNVPGTGAGSGDYDVLINGVASGIVATLDITDTDGSDLVTEVAVLAGDLIGLRLITSGEGIDTGPSDITITLGFLAA